MKKPVLNARFSKIRFKLFVAILLVLILFFGIMTAVTSPALFYVLSGQTYRQHSNAADQIKKSIPGTVTYYFELCGLHCCVWLSLVAMSSCYSLVSMCRLLIMVTSLVAEQKL